MWLYIKFEFTWLNRAKRVWRSNDLTLYECLYEFRLTYRMVFQKNYLVLNWLKRLKRISKTFDGRQGWPKLEFDDQSELIARRLRDRKAIYPHVDYRIPVVDNSWLFWLSIFPEILNVYLINFTYQSKNRVFFNIK